MQTRIYFNLLFHDQIFICKREDYIALVQDLLNMVSVVHFPLGVFASYTFHGVQKYISFQTLLIT